MVHVCQRCNNEFDYKYLLIKHLKRKNPCVASAHDVEPEVLLHELECEDDKKYVCKNCKKKFKNKQSKYVHQKSCTTCVTPVENDMESLRKEVQELKQLIANTNQITNTTNNNTTNNINTTNIQNNMINVNLRSFGCENMEALPEDFVGNQFLFLKFKELLENLHCDPNYPENHNIRIKSTKRGVLEIYRGNDKWDLVSFVNGLNELLLQGHRIFKDYYRKNKEKILEEDMDEGDLRDILIQLEKIEKLSEDDVKPLRIDLQLMLEGHRNLQQLAQ